MNGHTSAAGILNGRWFCAALVAAGVVAWAGCTASSDKAEPSDEVQTLCLRTEFFPPEGDEQVIERRLVRELVRQAVLIAGRDELGLPTRDETLDEPFPESVFSQRKTVHIRVRQNGNGTCGVTLWRTGQRPPEGGWATDVRFENTPRAIYTSLAEQLEPLTRGQLVKALQGMGFGRRPAAGGANPAPPESIEGLLGKMDFVSQYGAVRQAHRAIAEHGQTQEWLGVLVRGYAHLAMLTQHHWTSSPEAFAARSLLYAERMVASAPQDALAHCHRAYAWAIIGLHNAALDEWAVASELQERSDGASPLPAWAAVIDPYCRFERDGLLKLGDTNEQLRQLVELLSFEQQRLYNDSRMLYASARRAIEHSPESYVVYANLAMGTYDLGPSRMAASYGPVALGRLMPETLAGLEGLPDSIAKAVDPDRRAMFEKYRDAKSGVPFSVVPGYLAGDLVTATRGGDDSGEPSWSALGALVAEEGFAQIASYFKVAQNATETSHADEVAAVMPMIRQHRYAPFIESYGVNYQAEPRRFYDVLGDMQFVDPRGNMQTMFHLTWSARDEHGKTQRGKTGAKYAFKSRDLVLPAMVEACERVSYSCWDDMDVEARKSYAREFEEVSRYCPHVLQTQMKAADKHSVEQLAEWESRVGDHPLLLAWIGDYYCEAEKYEDAARCYERSVELSPSPDRFISLADAYRKAGKEELWLPTLERYLEVEDFGLGHSQIQLKISRDLIAKGKWEAAEPYAWQAAQTYSGAGLEMASKVYEGLGRWNESEHWAREATTSYPTYSGYLWYFWCLRTGRGQVEQARQAADAYLKLDGVGRRERGQGQMFVAALADGKPQESLDHIKTLAEMCRQPPNGWIDRSYAQIHLAMVAQELKDSDAEQAAVAELRRVIDEEIQPQNPAFAAVNLVIWSALTGDLPDKEMLADLDERLEKLDGIQRCDYQYFIGRVHELRGETDVADEYYRRAVTRGPLDRHNATLAGYYLSKRHGTSRP